MSLFKKVLIVIISSIVLTILISSIIEMNALNTSRHNIRMAATVAGKYATESFEITQFSGFDDALGDKGVGSDLSTPFSMDDANNVRALRNYLDELENLGNRSGINHAGSDFKATLEFLREEIDNYSSSGSVISPFAFSWTFLEEERLKIEFDNTVRRIIEANYNPDNDMALAFSGKNVVTISETNAEIVNGPMLLNLQNISEYSNPEEYKVFLSLFGTTRDEALKMHGNINAVEKMYNYVIAYDVRYTINWQHHTITPFFKGTIPLINGDLSLFPAEHIDENNQIIIDMQPFVFTKRYVVTN